MMGYRKKKLEYAIYLIFIFSISYFFFLDITKTQPWQKPKTPLHQFPPRKTHKNARSDLEGTLAAASIANKTVIIAFVNKAYVDGEKAMLDLFLEGFRVGEGTHELINHLFIVAMDQPSYERCTFLSLHCYKLETQGVDFVGEKLYMSPDFINMMWARTLFLGDILKRGYSFIFTDTDVLWLKNPFPYLSLEEAALDLQVSTDKFKGNHWSINHRINTGFYMIRSNHKTVALFDTWYANKNNSTGLKEQDVLQNLMRRGLFRQLNLSVKYLDTLYFSGFCQDSRDVAAVATVHANCCRGMPAKLQDLTAVLHDWISFKNASYTPPFSWSDHKACKGSLKNFS